MPQSPLKYLPGLEPLEQKQLLSAGSSTSALARVESGARTLAARPADTSNSTAAHGDATRHTTQGRSTLSPDGKKPKHGYLMFRITNPSGFDNTLRPPFQQVLVQPNQPVPGQVYNVLFVSGRNGTAKTFNASNGFLVRFPTSGYTVPILTGNEQWKPGQRIVFYVLTKLYYPLASEVASGFEFNLGGAVFGHRAGAIGDCSADQV